MSEQQTPERKRSRSPGYPSFSLPEAIRRAEVLYKHDKRNTVPLGVAAEHWGYSPSSSAVLLSVATLKKYGLLDEVGGGSSRMVRLTDLALHIILGTEGAGERLEAIREAAMAPAIHTELWNEYGPDLPSDSNLKRTLILDKGFGDAAAHDLIREYRETISFARLNEKGTMGQADDGQPSQGMLPMIAPAPTSPTPPPAANTANFAGIREYRFPLIESADAELRLPVPMTEENYELLQEQVEAFLKVTKRALVGKNANRETGGAVPTE